MSTATPVSKYAARPNTTARSYLPRVAAGLASTVGSKFLVALTGLALTLFVYVHMAGNLLVFRGPEALNDYAEFLKAHAGLLWSARIGLLAVFVLHIALALRLKRRNLAARPTRYVHEATMQASWASRNMVLTGLVILAFVIFHLLHYTVGIVQQIQGPGAQPVGLLSLHDVHGRPDVYAMVIHGFRAPWIVITYVIAQILLGIHLSHGIASMFQSMGWTRPTTWPLIRRLGVTLAALVMIGNIAMPLAVYFGFVGTEYIPWH
jgi:succinate dehydrogenase / fumarate reductase, cytochrome b subunit